MQCLGHGLEILERGGDFGGGGSGGSCKIRKDKEEQWRKQAGEKGKRNKEQTNLQKKEE